MLNSSPSWPLVNHISHDVLYKTQVKHSYKNWDKELERPVFPDILYIIMHILHLKIMHLKSFKKQIFHNHDVFKTCISAAGRKNYV